MKLKYAFVLAGTHSGAGKTTATLTLLATLHEKAMLVQPFKVGPDYLDPGYHNLFSGGKKSRNLDSFLLSEDYILESFWRNTARADVAVVEGVMGMYDGSSSVNSSGSTADIAKILGLPVILIVDAQRMAQSAGAVILGFKCFDPSVNLRGVIFNRVAGPGHYEYLKKSISPDWGVEPLGFIPQDREIEIPERHLGLCSALENPLSHSFFDCLRKASEHIEIDRLLDAVKLRSGWQESLDARCSVGGLPLDIPAPCDRKGEVSRGRNFDDKPPMPRDKPKVRIGVAYDEAFSFYYEDNFDLLRKAGAELVFFSPLYRDILPPGLDALYFGGGFPEMFAPKLSRNLSMSESIQKFAKDRHFIYAECGGLIYLAEKFKDPEGQVYPLAGLVPGQVEMTPCLQSFGYKEIRTHADTFLFAKNELLRAHEFHYSQWTPSGHGFECPYEIQGREDGFWAFPVLASYQHLHFGSHPSMAERFVDSILEAKSAVKAFS